MKHLMSVSKDLAKVTDPIKASKNLKVCDSIFKTPEQKNSTKTRKAPITK